MFSKLKQFPGLFIPLLCVLTVAAQPGPSPAADRMQALELRKQMEKNSAVNTVTFRNIGPVSMSGRVSDIDVNPADPTEFYVAYSTGGLWHTTNNGQSFTPVGDSLDVLFMGDIAVNWNTRTIWVGTGEVNSSRSSYAGTGVYKTNNNGKTWEYLGLPESHHIGKVQLHPTDPNTAWVAVLGHLYSPNKERGVYKTTDGGKGWKQVLFADENTGCVDIDINPANPDEVYAGMWYRTRRAWKFEESGSTGGIYKSKNGGASWEKLSGPGSGFMTGNKMGRIGLSVYPKNPQVVYAVVDNYHSMPDTSRRQNDTLYRRDLFKNITKEQFEQLDNKKLDTFLKNNPYPRKYTAVVVKELVKADKVKPTALWDYLDSDDGFQGSPIGCQVYRSDDGGKSWKKTHEKPINIYNTYGYYFGKIYVSPVNADKVYILGFYAQVSTDGGKTFKTIDKASVHADHHALWINPARDSHIINGNDGGVNISYDNGDNWFKANTPAVGQFYAITTDDEKPYNVYGGLQDNGVWYFPSVQPRNSFANSGLGLMDGTEKPLGGGDGMQVQVDTRDNQTTYFGSQFGSYARTNRLNPGRGNNRRITPMHELGEKPLRFNWQTPIWLSRHNQDVLYYGASRVYRSLVKGDTMIAMSADLTNGKKEGNVPYGTITTISESPLRFGLIYTGTDDGNVHLSKDGGYTWELLSDTTRQPAPKDVKLKNPRNGFRSLSTVSLKTNGLWVSRVTASAHKEGRVYASLNGYRFDHFEPYIFVSEDYGHIWHNIGIALPPEPVNVIKEDPKNEKILYAGTDGGLYVSLNGGNSWELWNAGMPKSVPVHDIVIHARENEIVVGTHGRSVYVAKLGDIQKMAK